MSESINDKGPSVVSVVALGNRMLALKTSPGFHDLIMLAEMLESEAQTTLIDYPGFDRDELFVLKVRAQVAKEFVAELKARIDGAISNAHGLPGFSGDEGPKPTESRIPGSY